MIDNIFCELNEPSTLGDDWYVSTVDSYAKANGMEVSYYLHDDLTLHDTTGFDASGKISASPGYYASEDIANQHRDEFYRKFGRKTQPNSADAFDRAMKGI